MVMKDPVGGFQPLAVDSRNKSLALYVRHVSRDLDLSAIKIVLWEFGTGDIQ